MHSSIFFGFMKCFWHSTIHGLINLHIYSTDVLGQLSLPGGKACNHSEWSLFKVVAHIQCVFFVLCTIHPTFSWPIFLASFIITTFCISSILKFASFLYPETFADDLLPLLLRK